MKRDPLLTARWRKSSRSQNGSANCVELATLTDATAVRDSKNPSGPTLAFAPSSFGRFLTHLRQQG